MLHFDKILVGAKNSIAMKWFSENRHNECLSQKLEEIQWRDYDFWAHLPVGLPRVDDFF